MAKKTINNASTKKTTRTSPATIRATAASTAPVNVPGPQAVADFMGLTHKPALPAVKIQRMRRALPGYVNLLDDVAELVAEDHGELKLEEGMAATLLDLQRRQKDLSAREAVLQAAYVSAYHQRLSVDDEGMGMLQQIARRIQSRAEENPDLLLRYKSLIDFLGTFRGGGRTKKEPTPSEPATPVTA